MWELDRPRLVAVVAVAAHLLAGVAHGIPHAEVPVPLADWQTAFVWVVATGTPVVALGLLWTRYARVGAALLAVSMAAAFAFGAAHHYVLPNPDNVRSVPGPWRVAFGATATAVGVTDLAGVAVGAWLWLVGRDSSSAAPSAA